MNKRFFVKLGFATILSVLVGLGIGKFIGSKIRAAPPKEKPPVRSSHAGINIQSLRVNHDTVILSGVSRIKSPNPVHPAVDEHNIVTVVRIYDTDGTVYVNEVLNKFADTPGRGWHDHPFNFTCKLPSGVYYVDVSMVIEGKSLTMPDGSKIPFKVGESGRRITVE